MLIYEYKCLDCNSIFEDANSDVSQVSCLFCEGKNVMKSEGDNWKIPSSSCDECKGCSGCN